MRHYDLGQVDGPVLAFGGPYSNLQATQAVLDLAASKGALPLCTGDIVAYCARPSETVAAVRGSKTIVIAGNCERQLGAHAPDCGCGFDEGSACDLLSVGWYGFADARIGSVDRTWMDGLPDIVTFDHAGLRWAVIHGGATDIARFVWPTSPQSVFEEEWRATESITGPVDCIIAGHCGMAFARDVGQGVWINAGVIGMPPHDGGQATRYALIEGDRVTFHDLEYDVEAAVQDMEVAGLTHGYDRALRSGYWPSEDVLPPDLRRDVSEPLASG